MVNVTIIFGLLIVPYLIAYLFHLHNLTLAGRMGICLVFLFAALGHFFKTDSMISMLPPFVRARRAVIYVSGVLEILFAIAVVSLPNPSYVGWMIGLYLIPIFLPNVYATIHRIPLGGHHGAAVPVREIPAATTPGSLDVVVLREVKIFVAGARGHSG